MTTILRPANQAHALDGRKFVSRRAGGVGGRVSFDHLNFRQDTQCGMLVGGKMTAVWIASTNKSSEVFYL